MPLRVYRISWIVVLAVVLSSCKVFPSNFDIGIDLRASQEMLQTLNSAITSLNQQPSQWQQVLTTTVTQLDALSQRSINQTSQQMAALLRQALQGVQGIYTTLLGQTQVTAFCGVDFLGRRAQQQLQSLGHSLFPRRFTEPTRSPVVCATNPPTQVEAGTTRTVTYYGFDFQAFDQRQFEVALRYANGRIIKPRFGFIAIPHNYELVVDLQAVDYGGINPKAGPQLVLRWNNQLVQGEGGQSALPVLLPTNDGL